MGYVLHPYRADREHSPPARPARGPLPPPSGCPALDPLYDAAIRGVALIPHLRPVDLSGVKVLVVDDQAIARDLVARVLSDWGAEVITSAGAEEALLLLQAERPQILISDIGMPHVDGFELLTRVRALGEARGGRTAAIALTAFARTEDRTRALHHGFRAHLSKPVEPAELIATVASVAGRTDAGG